MQSTTAGIKSHDFPTRNPKRYWPLSHGGRCLKISLTRLTSVSTVNTTQLTSCDYLILSAGPNSAVRTSYSLRLCLHACFWPGGIFARFLWITSLVSPSATGRGREKGKGGVGVALCYWWVWLGVIASCSISGLYWSILNGRARNQFPWWQERAIIIVFVFWLIMK